MQLRNSEESLWGSVEDFFLDVSSVMANRNVFLFESEVWGKLHRKSLEPRIGDGFAFYHTRKAKFARGDLHHRRPRISLVGNLRDFRRDGQRIEWLSVELRRHDVERMRHAPIVRDDATEHLFQSCGMIPGPVATFFKAPPDIWDEFLELAGCSGWSEDGISEQVEFDVGPSGVEGETKRYWVRHRRREVRLREVKLLQALARSPDGRIRCEVPGCGFDFEEVYGELGHRFAEVHHLRPLADRSAAELTSMEELVVVCSNCHRMIHRHGLNRPLDALIRDA